MPWFNRTPNVTRMKAKHDLKGLVKALHYVNPKARWPSDDIVREDAAKALVDLADVHAVVPLVASLTGGAMFKGELAVFRKLGDPAVDALIAALPDKDAQKRKMTVYMLGALKNARAVEALIAMLNDGSADVRRAAAIALMDLRDARAVDPLSVALRDADEQVRVATADALAKFNDARTVEPFIAALKDNSMRVRLTAATALGKLGDARAVEPLGKLLRDRESEVRSMAATMLSDLGDARSLEPLIAALGDSSHQVRLIVAKALGKLGDTRAVEPLGACLNELNTSANAAVYGDVRKQIIESLGLLKDTRAFEPLVAALDQKDWGVFAAAAKVLGDMGDPRAVESLIAALNKPGVSQDAWDQVIASLAKFKDSGVTEPLIAELNNPDWFTRSTAVKALGVLGDARAIPPLMALLGSDSPLVKEANISDVLAKLLRANPQAAEAAAAAAPSIPTKTYARSTDRWALALEYPENWETVLENEREGDWLRVVALARRLQRGAVGVNVQVALFEVLQRNEGVVEIGISTDGEVMRKPRTLEEYVDKSKGELRDIFRGLQFIESKVETPHGLPAASMFYTYPNDRGSKTKEYNLTLFDPDSTYQLIFELPEPVYEVYWPLCQAMIASFRCGAAARPGAPVTAATEATADHATLAPVQLYNRGVDQYQHGDYPAAMRSFTACAQSGAYREQAFYARSLCQKKAGQPIEIPTELDDPEAAGVRYTASNLVCYLIGKGYAVALDQDKSWYWLTFAVDGAAYRIGVGGGLLGGFAFTVKRQAGEESIDIRDSGQNPTPLPSDIALVSTLLGYPTDTTKAIIDLDRIPLSPLPASGLAIG